MLLTNCEISLDLTRSKDCVTSSAAGKTKFAVKDKELYVPVVDLSTEDNIRLLKQLESGLKRKINWNKYQSKLEDKEQNRYFDYLIDPRLQGVNGVFALSLENRDDRKVLTKYYISKAEIKDYNIKKFIWSANWKWF